MVGTVDATLPGFGDALLYARFLSPADYQDLVGLRCAPSPHVPPVGVGKLSSYDAERDLHYVGTSVGPPGEHAGAAFLSGKLAAQAVLARRGSDRRKRPRSRGRDDAVGAALQRAVGGTPITLRPRGVAPAGSTGTSRTLRRIT